MKAAIARRSTSTVSAEAFIASRRTSKRERIQVKSDLYTWLIEATLACRRARSRISRLPMRRCLARRQDLISQLPFYTTAIEY